MKMRIYCIEKLRWCATDLTDSERSPTYGCYWHGNEPSGDVNEGSVTTLRKCEYEPMMMVLELLNVRII